MKVAIGPVFDEFGGVSQHIFGIKKYSANRIFVIPSKVTRTLINKSNRGSRIYQKAMSRIGLNNYDVVHSHVDPWFTDLCLSSRTDKCKWVHTYHTLYFDEDYPNGLSNGQKKINKNLTNTATNADVKISISKWLHDYLNKKYQIQTEIVPNGVDVEACNRAKSDRFFRKYGMSEFILFVGNIQTIKNSHFFINLAANIPEVKFIMIGRSLNANDIMKHYRISIPENLTLLGELNHNDTLDAISACKTFVMTSKREGIPTTLLEAMAMGKNVVAPAHTGCKEVIQNNYYGFLYEPGSIDDLIEKTKQSMDSKHIGENARELIRAKYDWKILAKKIDLLYEYG